MTAIEANGMTVQSAEEEFVIDEAHLAAVAFLARYSGESDV